MVCVMFAQVEEYSPPGLIYWLLVFQWLLPLFGVAFYVLLGVCIYRAAKYFGAAGKEQKLLRIEMGKLAEEVRVLRQELKDSKNRNSDAREF